MRILLLAFTIAFSGAAAPGPMLALVMAQALAQGVPAVLLILAGHGLIEIVFVGLLAGGLGRWLGSRVVSGLLSLTGGYVLVWLGLTLVGQATGATLSGAAAGAPMRWFALLFGGIGVSLSNPYFTSWWATVGTGQMASLQLRRRRDYVLFLAGHEMGDVVWYVTVALVLVTGRHWLNDRVYQGLLVGCGVLVAGLGVVFVGLGARRLLARSTPGMDAEGGPGSAIPQMKGTTG